MSLHHSMNTLKFDSFTSSHQTISYIDHGSIQEQPNIIVPVMQEIQIGEVLGEGGMGIVYLGHQSHPKRDVAIKRLKYKNNYLWKALYREAMITGSLSHPTVIPVHMLTLVDNTSPEVVMKRVEGKTMLEMIAGCDQNAITRKLLDALLQVCNGLEYAHSKGIYHRDIKPENIMLGDFGEIYILDWGIASQKIETMDFPKVLVGTLAYMAPEMLSGDPLDVDERTDVYLLGSTLHHILTGDVRHTAKSMDELTLQILESKPYTYNRNIPKLLERIVNQACHRDPEKRIQSPAEFRRRIEEYLDYSQAFVISKAACAEYHIFENLVAIEQPSLDMRHEIQKHYNRSRFGFEQALDIWPDFITAQNHLNKTKITMISYYLSQKNLDAAKPLLEEVDSLPIHLRKIVEELEIAQETQKHDLELYRLAQDKKQSSTYFRSSFAVGILSICFIMTYFLFQIEDIDPNNLSPKTLFIHSVSMFFPILPLIIIGRKKRLVSSNGRQASIAIVGLLLTIILHRWIAMDYQEQPTSIIVTDLFIAGFGLSNTAPSIRYGRELGVMCIVIGIVNHNFSITFWFGTLVLMLVLGICVYGDWRRNWNEPNIKKEVLAS